MIELHQKHFYGYKTKIHVILPKFTYLEWYFVELKIENFLSQKHPFLDQKSIKNAKF